jgi:hypothetical protein
MLTGSYGMPYFLVTLVLLPSVLSKLISLVWRPNLLKVYSSNWLDFDRYFPSLCVL